MQELTSSPQLLQESNCLDICGQAEHQTTPVLLGIKKKCG